MKLLSDYSKLSVRFKYCAALAVITLVAALYELYQYKSYRLALFEFLNEKNMSTLAIFSDLKKFSTLTAPEKIESSYKLIQKYQTNPLAYIVFAPYSGHLLYTTSIDPSATSFAKKYNYTAVDIARAKSQAGNIISLYKKNHLSFDSGPKEIQVLAHSHPSVLVYFSSQKEIEQINSSNKEQVRKIEVALSQLEEKNKEIWQQFYRQSEEYFLSPKSMPKPQKPQLSIEKN